MLSRSEEKLVRLLDRRRARETEGLFLAEGVRVVEELLDAGLVLRFAMTSSSLEDTDRGAALAQRLADHAPVRSLTDGELRQLAGTRSPQGVLVVAETPRVDLAELRPGNGWTGLVLDGVQEPGNLGTLARSAAAFGCGLLACLPGTVDPWNAKSVRASAGALFRIPVVESAPDELWSWLAANRVAVLGADADGSPVSAQPRGHRAALVVGNEGAGLSDETRARCTALVAVPMRGGTESLNVAVATGILLYELTRERE